MGAEKVGLRGNDKKPVWPTLPRRDNPAAVCHPAQAGRRTGGGRTGGWEIGGKRGRLIKRWMAS